MLLVPVLAAAALVAGCTSAPAEPATNGVDKLEPAQILQKATEALQAAKSFRVQGKGEIQGQTSELDLTYVGKQTKGTITYEGVTLELIQTADATYVTASDDFWKKAIADQDASVQALVLSALAGKWVKLPSAATDTIVPDGGSFLQPEGEGELRKGDIVTVDGKRAIELLAKDGKLRIALEGEPYPIDIVSDDGGALKFLDVDKDVTIEAPTGVVDLTEILTQIMTQAMAG